MDGNNTHGLALTCTYIGGNVATKDIRNFWDLEVSFVGAHLTHILSLDKKLALYKEKRVNYVNLN
jgi:hypothetical protein